MDDPPTKIDPYKSLGIQKTATNDQIRSAYRKCALKWHPDKAEDKEAAHVKFQEIAFAYAVLSDDKRRKRYDSTGRTAEVLTDDDFDWATFFKTQFADVVTFDAIKSFSETYKGSDEEKKDLFRVYTAHRGNMTKVYQDVMLSDPCEDDERFRSLIRQGIEDGKLDAFDKFTQESAKSIAARIRRAGAQAKEAEQHAKDLGIGGKKDSRKGKTGDDISGLAALIGQRQVARAKLFEKDFPSIDEPPEEAFAANRRKGSDKTDKENTQKRKASAEPARRKRAKT